MKSFLPPLAWICAATVTVACGSSDESHKAGGDAGSDSGPGGASSGGRAGSGGTVAGGRTGDGGTATGGRPGTGGTSPGSGGTGAPDAGVEGGVETGAGGTGAGGATSEAGTEGGTPATGLAPFGTLVARTQHTCAILAGGSVACWGYNSSAQLGNGNLSNEWMPHTVAGLADVVSIGTGTNATCAVQRSGAVHCWGDTVNTLPVPMNFASITARSVALAATHKCLVTTSDQVYCWGRGFEGQLGDGTNTSATVPVQPRYASTGQVVTEVAQVAAASNHTCALKTNGTVACWGQPDLGSSGDGGGSTMAVDVPGITTATAIATGEGHACVVLSGGTLQCWGALTGVGSGALRSSLTPVTVPGLTKVAAVSTGNSSTCALTSDRRLYCWGYVGTVDEVFTPRVMPLTGVVAVANGVHTCALLQTGVMECWGSNQYGQLGLGHLNAINSGPNPGVTTVIGGAVFWQP